MKKLTLKQVASRQNKIKKIRAVLETEKRKFGCFDDSRGLKRGSNLAIDEYTDYRATRINKIVSFNRNSREEKNLYRVMSWFMQRRSTVMAY